MTNVDLVDAKLKLTPCHKRESFGVSAAPRAAELSNRKSPWLRDLFAKTCACMLLMFRKRRAELRPAQGGSRTKPKRKEDRPSFFLRSAEGLSAALSWRIAD